ncbi:MULTISPECIES: low specificity L-threonine aldolase [Vagococcus]|uniref:threonine aldolase family protein n=1 Tax=Vagococcus TaxID=2737 RepID=UPI000E48670A|nr:MULTISPECIES: low specificity L-threonine aldolase [Vagococcus]RHH67276.1 low specificity L-threonine aldolase [Vagococcus sp. AM17-17]
MISFANDYLEGAHEKVLNRLIETNMEQEFGYGSDSYSKEAIEKIKELIECPDASIRFLVGGTQTNQVVIDSVLDKFEGVLAPETGHINVREAGAIEYSGHKVLTLPSESGKISVQSVKDYLDLFNQDETKEHMVTPGMVYISFPTEYGTLYSYDELEELSRVCHENNLPLFIDGARLGYGLVSDEADVTIKDIAHFSDVFYIGGTKIGALCGEAVVFTKNNEPRQFVSIVKQHGALLAKGRLLGVQFLTLFTDNLYFDISKHAVDMSQKIKRAFLDKGYELYFDSPTNQQFVIMTNEQVKELKENISFATWEKYDDLHMVIRFVTSWGTSEENVEKLISYI